MGPLVVPGKYRIELNVAGKTYSEDLTILPDPRVKVTQQDLEQQLDAEKSISAQMAVTYDGYNRTAELAKAIAERQKALDGNAEANDAADALKALGEKVALVENGARTELGLGPLNRELARLAIMIESGDARPAEPLQAGVDQYCEQLQKRVPQWREANQAIAPVNTLLQKYNLAPLPMAATIPDAPKCGG